MANDTHIFPRHVRVVKPHLHRIVHLASEGLLTLVGHRPREHQGAWPHGDAGDEGAELLLPRVQPPGGALLQVLQSALGPVQLVGQGPAALHVLPRVVHGVHGELVVAVPVVGLPDDVHLGHVAVEVDVGQDAHLRGAEVEVLDHPVPGRPDLPVLGRAQGLRAGHGPLRPVPHVVRGELGLQLRGLVGHLQPGVAADLVVPVEHDEVVPRAHGLEEERRLQAAVARADDAVRVRVLVPWRLEALEALHRHGVQDLLGVKKLLVGDSLLHHEVNLLRLYIPHLCCKNLLQLTDRSTGLNWHVKCVSACQKLAVKETSTLQLTCSRPND
mmetsp:Transcript_78475/g.230150  ORF Transcript_78475/g.230150 Transcript_78475/m.230150 type:complete len:328 (+) Transcript_78475:1503-2486(+)